jgi:hypothetical protein
LSLATFIPAFVRRHSAFREDVEGPIVHTIFVLICLERISLQLPNIFSLQL